MGTVAVEITDEADGDALLGRLKSFLRSEGKNRVMYVADGDVIILCKNGDDAKLIGKKVRMHIKSLDKGDYSGRVVEVRV